MGPPALASAVRVNSLEILALLAVALCASFVLAPACAADLIWEVENPFRFFKPTRSFALHETAFNAVRFRVKPGRDEEFLDAHKKIKADWPGLQRVNMIKTGDRSYCIVAEWSDMDALAKARPNMIATLDTFRDTLEDLGGGLGVTDPVSGPVVLALK